MSYLDWWVFKNQLNIVADKHKSVLLNEQLSCFDTQHFLQTLVMCLHNISRRPKIIKKIVKPHHLALIVMANPRSLKSLVFLNRHPY